MQDALLPPGFVSSVPSMPSAMVHAGEYRALLFTEPGGSNGADFLTSNLSPPLSTQAAASCCTHTTEGDTRRSACGFRAGDRPDFQASIPAPVGARNSHPWLEHRLSGLYRSCTALGIEDMLLLLWG